jgi:hypothetical protein
MLKSKFEVIEQKENQSKKRKTYHYGDNIIVNNPLQVYDLKEVGNLQKELDSKSCHIDYVMNSHKKRSYNDMDAENKIYVSNIPKPNKNVNIYYSKYAEYPSKIPKSCLTN